MDVFTLGAALLGLAGAVLGFLGWQQAREAKSIAERAYREVGQSRQGATDAPRAVAEIPTAASAAPPALPDVSPVPEAGERATRPDILVETQPLPRIAESTAQIVVRSGSDPGNDLPTNQGTGSGLIGIFLVNDGPAVAHDMQLHATFPNGTKRSSELHRTLTPHKELTLYAQVVPADFGAHDPLHLHYQVAYRDGNGARSFERDIRLEGGWKGPWKTYIQATSDDRIEV